MRESTNENIYPGPIQSLGLEAEIFLGSNNIEDSDFWADRRCFKHKLSGQRLKMKSNSEKRRLLVKQHSKRAEAAKFIIDYIPLCMEEDWEMMARFLSVDQQEKPD